MDEAAANLRRQLSSALAADLKDEKSLAFYLSSKIVRLLRNDVSYNVGSNDEEQETIEELVDTHFYREKLVTNQHTSHTFHVGYDSVNDASYDDGSSVGGPMGMIVEGQLGCGKTHMLASVRRVIENIFNVSGVCSFAAIHVVYFDLAEICNQASASGRYEAAINTIFIKLKSHCNSSTMLILIDNIDYVSSITSGPSLSRFNACFLSNVDKVFNVANNKVCMICTCTDIKSIPVDLLQAYRFNKPVVMTNAAESQPMRYRFILHFLQDCSNNIVFVHDCDDSETTGDIAVDVAYEISTHTHGFSICDLIGVIVSQYHRGLVEASFDANRSIKVLLSRLLHTVSITKPTLIMSSVLSRFIYEPVTPPCIIGIDSVINTIENEVIIPYSSDCASNQPLRLCSGMLIYGPSGSGKSNLASWIAYRSREYCKSFIIPCADLVQKVVGESEKQITKIFSTARGLSPCFIILENIEIILGGDVDDDNDSGQGDGGYRSKRTSHKALDRLLSTLLVEIDGINSSGGSGGGYSIGDKRVFVIATATRLDCLDKALIRPGRLELHIQLKYPDKFQRKLLLYNQIQQVSDGGNDCCSITLPSSDHEKILDQLVSNTDGSSYASIQSIVQEAMYAVIKLKIHDNIEPHFDVKDLFFQQIVNRYK